MSVSIPEFPIVSVLSLSPASGGREAKNAARKIAAYAGVRTRHVLLAGDPAECAHSAIRASGTSLLVMATNAGAGDGKQLGSCAEKVLESCDCPALLVPPKFDAKHWRLRKIVLPQDGTPSMAVAIRPALQIASGTGASLIVTSIITSKDTPGEPGTLAVPRYIDQPQYEWPNWTDELLERVRSLGCSPEQLNLKFRMGRGEPGAGIVEAAVDSQADLIILGWHGSLAADRAGVFRKVIESAPCPILTARISEAQARAA